MALIIITTTRTKLMFFSIDDVPKLDGRVRWAKPVPALDQVRKLNIYDNNNDGYNNDNSDENKNDNEAN